MSGSRKSKGKRSRDQGPSEPPSPSKVPASRRGSLAIALVLGVILGVAATYFFHVASVPKTSSSVGPAVGEISPEMPAAPKPGSEEYHDGPTHPGTRFARERVDTPAIDENLLRSIPYIAGTVDTRRDLHGVTFREPGTSEGINLYGPARGNEARLIDMGGTVLHRWRMPANGYHMSWLLPDGSLLAILQGNALVRLDRNSEMTWAYRCKAHHSLWVEDERIYVATHTVMRKPEIHPDIDVIDERITVLDMDGHKIDEFSVLDSLRRSEFAYLLPFVADRSFTDGGQPPPRELDLLHLNSVEVFDGSDAEHSPLFARGNVLVGFRNIHTIAILDGKTKEPLWAWGPSNLANPHHPSLLPTGNILVFNNGLERSQLLEINPRSGEVEWRYAPESDFFSETRGSCQRLPNGNTLVTDSNVGRAFEITPDGRRVWEFIGPDFNPRNPSVRMAIYRMTRYPPGYAGFMTR